MFTVQELKTLLAAKGLPTTGNKADLEDRLDEQPKIECIYYEHMPFSELVRHARQRNIDSTGTKEELEIRLETLTADKDLVRMYNNWTVDELRAQLKYNKLTTVGLKHQLVNRLASRVLGKRAFMYINTSNTRFNNVNCIISSVVFDIGTFGKHKQTINFNDYVTELQAFLAVEEYLSEPMSKGYYDVIKDDVATNLTCFIRGDALGDFRRLFRVTITDHGCMTIFCCSVKD